MVGFKSTTLLFTFNLYHLFFVHFSFSFYFFWINLAVLMISLLAPFWLILTIILCYVILVVALGYIVHIFNLPSDIIQLNIFK